MVRIVPGGSTILDATASTATQRGFGSGGTQVLINGRRFPGKSNEIATNLRRIASASVERIELISGAAQGISTQSSGILVNVVLKPGAAIADVGSWELAARVNDAGRREADGLASYTRSRDGWTWKGGVERNVWSPQSLGMVRWSDRTRAEAYFYPGGQLQESRPQTWQRDHSKWIYTGAVRYDFAGGQSLELNGFYQTLDVRQRDTTYFTRFDAAGAATLAGSEFHQQSFNRYRTVELSGDFQARLGGGELDALFIHHLDTNPATEFRNRFIGAGTFEISRSESEVRPGEDIGRLTWTRRLSPRRSLEFGGEMARNTLDQDLLVYFDLNGDGRVELAPSPITSVQVRESRSELFATLRLTGGGRTSFEGGLTYERSRITNNYPFNPGTRLAYFKPRLDFRLNGRRSGQFRLTIERKISQLDFNNFVPKFNVVDSRIDAGNPLLQPERTWSYELGYEQRVGGNTGLVELRWYYDDLTGAIDKVPLRDALGLYSASGNIAAAHRTGAELKSSLRLGALHLPDALLSVRYQYQHSALRDPFTGVQRRVGNDRGNNFEVSFRHDLKRHGTSYGFTYRDTGGNIVFSDLPVYAELYVRPVIEAFVERRLSRALVLRLEGQNLFGARETQERTLYAVNAINGTVARRDYYDERRDARFALRLRGRF
jgi:outer membrane receptor protein involved in Fe transport